MLNSSYENIKRSLPPMWTAVHHCGPLSSIVLRYYLPLFHRCAPMCTAVYHCAPLLTSVNPCLHNLLNHVIMYSYTVLHDTTAVNSDLLQAPGAWDIYTKSEIIFAIMQHFGEKWKEFPSFRRKSKSEKWKVYSERWKVESEWRKVKIIFWQFVHKSL